MGLYINKNQLNIYRNGVKLDGNNQDVFIYNRTSEMVKEQAHFNELIESHVRSIKALNEHQHAVSERKWMDVSGQLKELEHFSENFTAVEQELMQQLRKLDVEQATIRKLIKAGQLKEEEVHKKWKGLILSHEAIFQQLEAISKENEQLADKVNKQLEIQEDTLQQLTSQHAITEKFEKRLDDQEALTEKITRQLDYFRSILFERTNYLAGKIEEVTHYLSQFFKNEGKVTTEIVLRDKQKQGK